MINIPANVVKAFKEAIARPENYVDGKVDYNFIEADVFLDCPKYDPERLYDYVCQLHDLHEEGAL